MSGPYESQADVAELVNCTYQAFHKRGVIRAKNFDRLLGVCSYHAVELGAYDRQVLRWLAAQPPELAEVIADLIDRAGQVAPADQ